MKKRQVGTAKHQTLFFAFALPQSRSRRTSYVLFEESYSPATRFLFFSYFVSSLQTIHFHSFSNCFLSQKTIDIISCGKPALVAETVSFFRI